MNPRVLKTSGFKHLDRAIDICAQNGIYTVIDMHTAPGGQNGGWHCDSGIHLAKFWEHKGFQDSLVWLWEEIAKRYKNNTWVAGYNLLNEPSDEKGNFPPLPFPSSSKMNMFQKGIFFARCNNMK